MGTRATEPDIDLPVELRDHPTFQVVKELGRGGMGVVYLARNHHLARLEVLKVVSASLIESEQCVERFRTEIRTAARLNHPNIVTAYSAPQAGALQLFAMEYVEGRDLARLVREKGALMVQQACHLVRQAATGLQHAFEQGAVHRDIKPHNLMVTRKGKLKILDFGLAKLASERDIGRNLTGQNAVMGTPEYIAPEQAADARSADIRADIFSLGCTLFYLLTGRTPFDGTSAMELVLAHIHDAPRRAGEFRTDLPEALEAVIARMLEKLPADRFQTPAEVAQALMPFVKPSVPVPAQAGSESLWQTMRPTDTPAPEKPWEGLEQVAGRPRRRRKSNPVATTIAGLGGLVAALALAMWAVSPSNVPEPDITPTPTPAVSVEAALKEVIVVGAPKPEELPPPVPEFKPLFNGKNLAGWKTHPAAPGRWRVANGLLVCDSSQNSILLTERDDYENVHVRIRARVIRGNSGLFVRSPFLPGVRGGYEAEMMERAGGRVDVGTLKSGHHLGAWPTLGADLPPRIGLGEWFDLEFIVDGYELTTKVNGVESARATAEKPKFAKGHIGVQALGSETRVEFETIQVREK